MVVDCQQQLSQLSLQCTVQKVDAVSAHQLTKALHYALRSCEIIVALKSYVEDETPLAEIHHSNFPGLKTKEFIHEAIAQYDRNPRTYGENMCNVWGPGDGPLEMYFEKTRTRRRKREKDSERYSPESGHIRKRYGD